MKLTNVVLANVGGKLLVSLWNTDELIPTVVEIYISKTDTYALYTALNEFFSCKLNNIRLTVSNSYQFNFINKNSNIELVVIDTAKDKQYSYTFENTGYHTSTHVNQIVAPKLRVIMEQLRSYFSTI